MTVRAKIISILSISLLIFIIFLTLLQYFIYYPSYISLERNEAKKDIELCLTALNREIYHMDILLKDWAAWDDTYEFIKDKNEDYKESNLIITSFTDNNLNYCIKNHPG